MTKVGQHLGLALTVIATAQIMLVLDDSVANIALPTIQSALGISAATLPWVINAYILAFGGLLLFGGRLGDLFGRRRMLQVGLVVFTLASILAGLTQEDLSLIAFRGLQGLGAALTAPNALTLADRPRVRQIAEPKAGAAISALDEVRRGVCLTCCYV